jgi:uncharacterized protein Usg
VNRRADTWTRLTRTFQPRRAISLLLAPTAAPALELCSSPSTPSPRNRLFVWQGTEDDGERTVWFTHFLLLQPDRWQMTGYGSAAVRLHRHPEHHAVLHASVSIQCHLSSYFPCSPSVTRFGADPAPCGNCATLLFRLSENLFGKTAKTPKEKIFRTFRKCVAWPWERGTSRRFAQECPEGNPGKYKQGESQWHSTKTT